MEFDVSRVYTAVNADELKVGSKVIVADTLADLEAKVEQGAELEILLGIEPDDRSYRFIANYVRSALAYLVEGPAKLKWTDLKVGDLVRKDRTTAMVTMINEANVIHVYINGVPMSDDGLEQWEKEE